MTLGAELDLMQPQAKGCLQSPGAGGAGQQILLGLWVAGGGGGQVAPS